MSSIIIKFNNGNEVYIYRRKTGLFTVVLNGKDTRTKISADLLALLLFDLRRVTCIIDSWAACYS